MHQLVANFEAAVPVLFATGMIAVVAAARGAIVRYRRGEQYATALANSTVAALLALTIVDILIITLMTHGAEPPKRLQLVPFADIRADLTSPVASDRNLVLANFTLFLPLGFLLPLRSSVFDSAIRTAGAAAGFALLIEAAQFVIGGHMSSIDDVILSTCSALTGFALMRASRGAFRRTLASTSKKRGARAGLAAPG